MKDKLYNYLKTKKDFVGYEKLEEALHISTSDEKRELGEAIDALEKDCLTRTESQDFGVNIIIGAGQYKQKLNVEGQEKYRNIFANIQNSKQTTYILIDNYEKIRTLKLEPWFDIVDKQSAIWLGPGIESQSLITCNELNNEDRKINYPAIAYLIDNGQYKIIKTAMDGD